MQHVRGSLDVDLVVQLRLLAAGYGDHDRLRRSILAGSFFAQAPEHPGFLASPTPDGLLIPVFTSELRLARHAGAVRWFSTTGLDLLALAPVGHRFVIDPGSRHEYLLDPESFVDLAEGAAG